MEIPNYNPNDDRIKTDIEINIDCEEDLRKEFTFRELIMGESLLTPGIHTSLKFHSYLHNPNKILDGYRNKLVEIRLQKKILGDYGIQDSMYSKQRIYRLDNRKLINNNVEEFVLHACHDTLLEDARALVSQSWKCTTPSEVVRQVLQSCVGSKDNIIESSSPGRDYIAKNIHPFQVINEQASVALADGNDPSFVHFMTYDYSTDAPTLGTHHFESLKNMTKKTAINVTDPYIYTETGVNSGYGYPYSIMTYSFPCDFDILSDLLNGVEVDGSFFGSVIGINPLSWVGSLFGNSTMGCGIGQGPVKTSFTNLGTEADMDSCNMDIENYLLKRQARMNLLEQDKIALRLTVPWNPELHAGKTIEVRFPNKELKDTFLYGSGKYLIASMTHNIKAGGYATTTMDCVAETAGSGIQ